ncbi:MAG: type II 3-dehydroquinate dehydratase [bacterium]|nr:type II 3-dehydroquinate dehydratase [bacterium]
MPRLLVLHGPNLNLLGKRDPEVYGERSLKDISSELEAWAREKGLELEFLQSNIEGDLIDNLQKAEGVFGGVVFNPGGFSHTSVALRDCISAIEVPVLEVHISNIHAREQFRRHTLTGEVSRGIITGLGVDGYKLAILQLAELI